MATPVPSDSDPFRAHLVALLAIYESGPSSAQPPVYDGPSDPQTDTILRSLSTIAQRMHAAEGSAPRQAPVAPVTSEISTSAVEELVLFKAQAQDVARVCDAVARGDLTQKVTATTPASGDVPSLANSINGMIGQLAIVATEVNTVSRAVGTEGKLGLQAQVGNAQGIWQEITLSTNAMAGNLTTLVRCFAQIVGCSMDGDFSRPVVMAETAEADPLRTQIYMMVDTLFHILRTQSQAQAPDVAQD